MKVRRLGLVPYEEGISAQLDARKEVLEGYEDILLILEHTPCVTLGKRGGDVDHERLAQLRTPVIQADRGGLATWHGPGQLVLYPIWDLRRLGWRVPTMIDALGQVLLETTHALGVTGAHYDSENPGVYIQNRKLGSIGLHIHRGVTTHGAALNVSCALDGFQAIVGCGYRNQNATSLSLEKGRTLQMDEVVALMLSALQARVDVA